MLSGFPVEIFDRTDTKNPRWPTFGVKIIPALPGADAALFPPAALPTLPPLRQLEQVLATALAGHDQTYIDQPCVRRRIIDVDTRSIGLTEFNANKHTRDGVILKGREAANQFLADWNWNTYKAECRSGSVAPTETNSAAERAKTGVKATVEL